jgi:hypothetical protein
VHLAVGRNGHSIQVRLDHLIPSELAVDNALLLDSRLIAEDANAETDTVAHVLSIVYLQKCLPVHDHRRGQLLMSMDLTDKHGARLRLV